MMNKRLPGWIAVTLVLAACGSVSSSNPDAPITSDSSDPVIRVAVTPDTGALKRGVDAPKQLSAVATRASSATEDVTASASWTTSNPAIATVTGGLVTATGVGLVSITASYDGEQGSATFTNTTTMMIVAETGPPALNFYDAFQSGDTPPVRRITGSATTLGFPWSMAIANDEIFVADLTAGKIDVFPLGSAGNVAPSRSINVANPLVVAIHGNELYTATNNGTVSTILVFPLNASGAATPTRTITGPATTLLAQINGLAFYNNEMYVSSVQQGAANIAVLPATASGNATATRTISGPNTKLFQGWDLRVVGGEIYVADLADAGQSPGVPGGTPAIHVYAATATGNTAPIREIVGPNSGIEAPLPMNILGDEILTINIQPFVAAGSLVVHPRATSGDTAPTRRLTGPNTGIVGPRGITFF